MLKYIYLDKGIPGVEQNNPTELPGTKNWVLFQYLPTRIQFNFTLDKAHLTL